MIAPGENLIFVLGVLPRSGTNFLRDLLCLHPQCQQAGVAFAEDYVLAESALLRAYVSGVERRLPGRALDAFQCSYALGAGLTAFLRQGADDSAKVVAKTPSVEGIQNVETFFPEAAVLILVRDGRDVVTSGIRSFEWEFRGAARRYAAAVDQILAFRATNTSSALVRYECLVAAPQAALVAILDFLHLDPAVYDFE